MHELCLGMDEEPALSLWVMTSGQTNMVDVVVGVCYRPPDQEKEVDGTLLRQLEEASRSQALVFMEDFNHPDICWKNHAAGHKQSRRFLDYHFTNDSKYSCQFLHPIRI